MDKAIIDIGNQIQSILDNDEIAAQEGCLVDTKLTTTNLGYYRTFNIVIRGKHKLQSYTITNTATTRYKQSRDYTKNTGCARKEFIEIDNQIQSVIDFVLEDINKQLLKELQARNLDPSEWAFELIDDTDIKDRLNFKIVRRHNYE